MAIPHAAPVEPVDVRPLGSKLQYERTKTLVKTSALEVIRLVLPAGKVIPSHQVPGELTAHCLEGKVVFGAGSSEVELTAGTFVYLEGSTSHSVRAVEDSSLLVTILLVHKDSSNG